MGVVATQGGTVVAEEVVRPAGFSSLILAGKQQETGAPVGPAASAVEDMGDLGLHCAAEER